MAKRSEASKIKTKLKKQGTTKIEKIQGKISIYSIWQKGKCVYVGSTHRPVEERWQEHKIVLLRGSHSNKTLQKIYDLDPNFEYKLEVELPIDNSFIQMMTEGLVNSIYKPKCNKIVWQTGRNRVVFARIPCELAEKILDVIIEYYGGKRYEI